MSRSGAFQQWSAVETQGRVKSRLLQGVLNTSNVKNQPHKHLINILLFRKSFSSVLNLKFCHNLDILSQLRYTYISGESHIKNAPFKIILFQNKKNVIPDECFTILTFRTFQNLHNWITHFRLMHPEYLLRGEWVLYLVLRDNSEIMLPPDRLSRLLNPFCILWNSFKAVFVVKNALRIKMNWNLYTLILSDSVDRLIVLHAGLAD